MFALGYDSKAYNLSFAVQIEISLFTEQGRGSNAYNNLFFRNPILIICFDSVKHELRYRFLKTYYYILSIIINL